MPLSAERKAWYFKRLEELLDSYSKIMLVQCDNVGSKQMADIRMALRGQAVVLLGKNTMIRKILLNYVKQNPGHPYELLVARIKGNVGFIFTNGDLGKVREVIEQHRVPAPARVGAVAPTDVFVPPGPTGCDPGQTSFFQVLQIPTKIAKGQIEITNEVHLVKKGEKVGNSEAALLTKLAIRPFTYGLVVLSVYDNGAIYGPEVLDLKDEDLLARFASGVANVAALSLGTGQATLAAFPHVVLNAYKNLLSIAVATDYTFKQAQKLKDLLANPEALKAALAAQSKPAVVAESKKEEKAPAKKEEPKKEEKPESDDMGFDLFG